MMNRPIMISREDIERGYFLRQWRQVPRISMTCSSHWNPCACTQWWGVRNSSAEWHFLQIIKPWSWWGSRYWQALHLARAGIWWMSFCDLRKSKTRYTVTVLMDSFSAISYAVKAWWFFSRKESISSLVFVFLMSAIIATKFQLQLYCNNKILQ